MAMSFPGAVLSGIGSSFHSGGAKTTGVGFVGVGRKTEFLVVSQRKKSLIYAEKGDGNILDDINEATKRASDYATEKTQEVLKDGEKAKDYVDEKNADAAETFVKEVKDAGNKVAEFVEGKSGEAKEATKS